MSRRALILAVSVASLVAGAFALSGQLSWRAQVLLLKAGGDLDYLTWSEMTQWLMPGSPVYVSNLLRGRNPHTALTTEGWSDELVEAGGQIYRERCASCHGVEGEGGKAGPALAYDLTRRSDWSIYQAMKTGIPGTSMQPQRLELNDAWNVVAYVRSLAVDGVQNPDQANHAKFTGPSFARLVARDEEQDNWLVYSGGYSGQRHSALRDVNRDTVGRLALKWVYQAPTSYDRVQANPIVADGLMIITEPPGRVVALNGSTGKIVWEFERDIPDDLMLCCGVVNRGVAVLEGLVYVATIDAYLIALEIGTGQKRWETRVADYKQGYSITAAPLVVGDKVITGVAGGETATRGFVGAYSADNGAEIWRFDTIPKPGQPGSETWRNELWEIGGAATWMTGSYDPELDLLFWGTSHTVQEPGTADRPSATKLYGSSLLAITGNTGELAWYFQFTPDDVHGFDAAQIPVLVNSNSGHVPERLLVTANRNGFIYVLDRTSGDFVGGAPFTDVTWAKGLDEHGSPIVDRAYDPSPGGTLSWPSHGGGTNWWPPAFNPVAESLCFPVVDGPSVFYVEDIAHEPGRPYVPVVGRQPANQAWKRFIRCMDIHTRSVQWEYELDSKASTSGALVMGGVLHTGGGLLFASDREYFLALDDQTGEELWRVNGGGNIVAPPVTYRIDETQYVSVTAGKAVLTFGLPDAPTNSE